jgi:hypothetical protein
MHQRVCREANVMARSSAFGASFCMRRGISILVDRYMKSTLQEDGSRYPHEIEASNDRRKLLVELCEFVKSRKRLLGICSFDTGDI